MFIFRLVICISLAFIITLLVHQIGLFSRKAFSPLSISISSSSHFPNSFFKGLHNRSKAKFDTQSQTVFVLVNLYPNLKST